MKTTLTKASEMAKATLNDLTSNLRDAISQVELSAPRIGKLRFFAKETAKTSGGENPLKKLDAEFAARNVALSAFRNASLFENLWRDAFHQRGMESYFDRLNYGTARTLDIAYKLGKDSSACRDAFFAALKEGKDADSVLIATRDADPKTAKKSDKDAKNKVKTASEKKKEREAEKAEFAKWQAASKAAPAPAPAPESTPDNVIAFPKSGGKAKGAIEAICDIISALSESDRAKVIAFLPTLAAQYAPAPEVKAA